MEQILHIVNIVFDYLSTSEHGVKILSEFLKVIRGGLYPKLKVFSCSETMSLQYDIYSEVCV